MFLFVAYTIVLSIKNISGAYFLNVYYKKLRTISLFRNNICLQSLDYLRYYYYPLLGYRYYRYNYPTSNVSMGTQK